MQIKLWCFALFLALVAIACDPFNYGGKHPSDAKLIRNFKEHEDTFQKLIKMSNQDPQVIRVAHDFTRLETNWPWPRPEPELGFSKQRWNEYQSLFNQLGLNSALYRKSSSNGAAIYLVASAKGLLDRGSSKGYVYSQQPLRNVAASLDSEPRLPVSSEHGAVYRLIKEHWYLCYEW